MYHRIELQRGNQSISTMNCWHSPRTGGQHRLPSSFPSMRKSYQDLQFPSYLPRTNRRLYISGRMYIHSRIHIGPALFLDRGSHWERERERKDRSCYHIFAKHGTINRREKRGWPVRRKKNRVNVLIERIILHASMSIRGGEARAIMMLAGRFIKHATARLLGWLISGYSGCRLSCH